MTLMLVAIALLVTGGVLAALTTSRPSLSSTLGMSGAIAGSIVGLVASLGALGTAEGVRIVGATSTVLGSPIVLGLDPLSAFFLVPLFAIGGLAAIYGRTYMQGWAPRRWLGPPWLMFDLMLAAIAMVMLARDAVSFLFAWEIMAVAAFVLVSFEHELASVRRAGWIYLVAAHVTALSLIAMFVLLSRETGSLELVAVPAVAPNRTAIFLLALFAFGVKAGVVPMHVWLPEAHAAAPSHVSAVLSAVLIKTGIYGLLRVLTLLGEPAAWWGPTLAVLGLAGGLVGISIAIYQHDVKRVLAYSSVENVGIILLGVGLGVWGVRADSVAVAALGFTGALLHVWNHALMKALLFLGAGCVVHGTGTKDMTSLGGLAKKMPRTAALVTFGAVAISALPPLNGFTGEWLLYAGLVQSAAARAHTAGAITALLGVGVLASIGTLTALCFVRLVSMTFLGQARSEIPARAHEAPSSMLAPSAALALVCAAIGLAPGFVVEGLRHVVAALVPGTFDLPQVIGLPLDRLGTFAALTWTAIAVVALVLRAMIDRNGSTESTTWGCGYAAPTARMQYVPGSFSELFAEHLLPRLLRARSKRTLSTSLLSPSTTLVTDGDDPVTRGVYEPVLTRWAARLSRVRWLQQGHLHLYLVYILVMLLAGLAWMSARHWSVFE